MGTEIIPLPNAAERPPVADLIAAHGVRSVYARAPAPPHRVTKNVYKGQSESVPRRSGIPAGQVSLAGAESPTKVRPGVRTGDDLAKPGSAVTVCCDIAPAPGRLPWAVAGTPWFHRLS